MSRYKLIRKLGEGGMGEVWEGRQIFPSGRERPIACKLIRPGLRERKSVIDMFYQESELTLAVSNNHPNIVSVTDHFRGEDGTLYLIMDLVTGCSLEDLITTYGRLSPEVTHLVISSVIDALDYIHLNEVLHRDLSPCNILITTQGLVRVTDFGLAKATIEGKAQSHNFRGKYRHASPEQRRCLTLDARSDLYSVGTIMYEMLVGKPIFGEPRTVPIGARDIADDKIGPLPKDVPRYLRRLTRSLTRAKPSKRPESAVRAMSTLGCMKPAAFESAVVELARRVTAVYEIKRARREQQAKRSSSAPVSLLVPERVSQVSEKEQTQPLTSMPRRALPNESQPRTPWLHGSAIALVCLALGLAAPHLYSTATSEESLPEIEASSGLAKEPASTPAEDVQSDGVINVVLPEQQLATTPEPAPAMVHARKRPSRNSRWVRQNRALAR